MLYDSDQKLREETEMWKRAGEALMCDGTCEFCEILRKRKEHESPGVTKTVEEF